MNNVKTNSPSFGMAVYGPTTKKVARVLGREAAEEFEKARPALEKIAKDIDIYIKPDKSWFEGDEPACNGFMMLAGKFKSKLDARLQLAKKFILPHEPNDGYAWVNLRDMSEVSGNLIKSAEKIKLEVK